MSDEELINLIKLDNIEAQEVLINRYRGLIEKKCNTYFLIGAGREDLMQEGYIGLYKAIKDYDSSKTSAFFSFAELCITRQIISAIKASMRFKHQPLNSYISFSQTNNNEDGDSNEVLDRIIVDTGVNPEEVVIGQEEMHQMQIDIEKALSDFEKTVLSLYLTGKNYLEIAEILGKESKSVDNALQRIKKKVEKIIKVHNEYD